MPIPEGTKLAEVPVILAAKIARYNDAHAAYNRTYANYVDARNAGIAAAGSLGAWIARYGAAAIQTLLDAFGMNAHNSRLVSRAEFQNVLSDMNPEVLNWVDSQALPFDVPPSKLVNPATSQNLSCELGCLYDYLTAPGKVTISGRYVAASKTMHCLFPKLAPMIDGTHSGISYYCIDRATYGPPLGLDCWDEWVGAPIDGVANPSPRAQEESCGSGVSLWLR